MPKYQVTITNEKDTNSRLFQPGESVVELCTADSPQQVEQILLKEVGASTDPSLYSWVIVELP